MRQKNSMLPLINTIKDGLKKFSLSGKLLLSPKKKVEIVDSAATDSEMKVKEFLSKLIKKAFIDSWSLVALNAIGILIFSRA